MQSLNVAVFLRSLGLSVMGLLVDEIISEYGMSTRRRGFKGSTYRDSRWGMAESWGPYRAALSYSSKRGIAKSFIFFGTARTSFKINGQLKIEGTGKQASRTSFRHLDQE